MARPRRVISGDTEWNPYPGGSGDFYNPEPTPIPRASSGGSRRQTMPTPAPTPRGTPSPTATPLPDFYEDRGGVRQNTPSMTIFPSGPDYAGTQGDDVFSGNFEGDRYQSFPPAPPLRLEPSFLFGGPSVETPTTTSTGSAGNLDNEPSLFPSPTSPVNAFDEWWRSTTEQPSVTINAGDGGSIWEGEDAIGGFDALLGSDLNASLGALGFGEGYPEVADPFNPVPAPTDIPVEPGTLPQPEGDSTWTTSPGDRRFLPGSDLEATPAPEAPSTILSGVDIRNFGGQRFGDTSGMSLGQFFSTPLPVLRYGGDRYQTQIGFGGRPPDLQPGEGYIDREAQGEGYWQRGAAGDTWVESGRQNASSNPRPRNDGTGTTFIPIPTENDSAPPGLRVVGHDEETGNPVYEDANGNKFVNPGTGRPVGAMSDRAYRQASLGGVTPTGYRDPRGSAVGNLPENVRNANLMLMANAAFGGTPNFQEPDEREARHGLIGRLNERGEWVQTGTISGTVDPENYRGFVYGSQRSTSRNVRGLPSNFGGGGR